MEPNRFMSFFLWKEFKNYIIKAKVPVYALMDTMISISKFILGHSMIT